MTGVVIRGSGVASSCCAHLLQQPNIHLRIEAADRPTQPAIMLSETTQKLLQDVFGRTDLLDGLPRIRSRVVAWGANAEPVALPHSAVVVSEKTLLNRIQPKMRRLLPDGPVDWSIQSSRPLQEPCIEREFGSRIATASPVKLKAETDRQTCWIESCTGGWLFLLPAGELADGNVDSEGNAWLLSVGDPVESLLAGSRLVADQIAEAVLLGKRFPSHPRIADPLCGAGWLACGTAALGFDPLCGDGAGHAVREAILASAVVRAAAAGEDAEALVSHYRSRLLAGFAKHLQICSEFYEQGQRGDWWSRELDSTRQGLDWCTSQLKHLSSVRYRLNNFALEPLADRHV